MKVSKQVLTLMVALAAGSASAAGTLSGTAITNTATADFTDPATNAPYRAPGATKDGVDSNPVKTTVLPKAGFDVVYQDGSPDQTTATTPAATYDKANVLPGAKVDTLYTIVNTGNVDGNLVKVAANVTGTSANTGTGQSGIVLTAADVTYYIDNGTTPGVYDASDTPVPAAGVPVPADNPSTPLVDEGKVQIIQRITIPALAKATDQFSASPQGQGDVFDPGTSTNVLTTEVAPTGPGTGDLQYTRATIAKPSIVGIPPTAIPNGTPTPTVPGATGSPTPPTGITGTTYAPPVNPNVTNNPGTVTVVNATSGDQDAYPKADVDPGGVFSADVVTFVGNVKNTGTLPDTIKIKPDLSQLPTGATVAVLDATGAPITPIGGLYLLPGGPVAPGGTVEYQIVVTYPDSDKTNPAANIVVPVGIFSGSVASTDPVTISTFTIHPPAALFGDTTGATTDPAAGNAPVQTVISNVAPSGFDPLNAADSRAVFPMTIKNTGQYADSFTLAGSVQIKLADGTTVTVPVKYYTTDPTPVLITGGLTPSILVNGRLNVLAVIDIPVKGQLDSNGVPYTASAAATNAANPQPTVSQKATGTYSTLVLNDNNDLIAVAFSGGITVAKTQSVKGGAFSTADASALPGDTLSYKIVATNTYNTSVFNFKLKDSNATGGTAFTYTTFVSASVALAGFTGQTPALTSSTVFYSVDGSTFSTTAPTPLTVGVNGIQVAIDTNNDGAITAADQVPAGASITLTINTTVK